MYYAALDIGTNNCRLTIAEPNKNSHFSVIDSIADMVLLGDELYETGKIGDAAIERGLKSLEFFASKLQNYQNVTYRGIATEICRRASNGEAFIKQIHQETGLDISIISAEEEARLAALSCMPMIKEHSDYAIIFEIGGGSTQVNFLEVVKGGDIRHVNSVSIPIGVLTASARWSEDIVNDELYQKIADFCAPYLEEFSAKNQIAKHIDAGKKVQIISASGTPATLASLQLKMNVYSRQRIDGQRFRGVDIISIAQKIRLYDSTERANYPIMGKYQLNMVGMGAALTESILSKWNLPFIDIADRGQRQGMLLELSMK